MCKQVSAYFDKLVTVPIKMVIGIDKYKSSRTSDRSWKGVKAEFEKILIKLDEIVNESTE